MRYEHYQKLISYCSNNNLYIYQEWPEWLMFAAEVPDGHVVILRAMDAAVNDDEVDCPTGAACAIK